MPMAAVIIGAVISPLVKKLADGIPLPSGELIKLFMTARIRTRLDKWRFTLTQIQDVLANADQNQVRKKSVELWLNKLHHLAYEIDDLLDDLVTEATRYQLNKNSHTSTSTSEVIKFTPNKLRTFSLKYHWKIVKIGFKLDNIATKLLDLVNQKQILGPTGVVVEPPVSASYRPIETTSLVDYESEMIGREGATKALLEKLVGGESSSSVDKKVKYHFDVVSIVGLGGIGKTTLAKHLYNDKKVEDHFDLMAWVCVSDVFDVRNISNVIYQAVGGRNQDFASLDLLQKALSEKIEDKKFLIVLDDVWNENYDKWVSLRLAFNLGAAGSKVIVTTRNSVVADVLKSVEAYSLELLTYEKAISLFAHHVSGSQTFDVNGALELYGEDIVKKCGSLPLALIALGKVFGKKSNVEEWVELLNSEIWNSKTEPTVLPALKLSYYDLPSHLKQMFVYCCLFPKDYTFDKDELVLLWMAEGYLYESNGNNSVESFGRECFEELLSRSFFQRITGDDSHYMMHDLIHDLATSVAGEFILLLDDKMDVQASEKFHNLSFSSDSYGVDKKFKALKNCKRLRTLLAVPVTRLNWWHRFDVSINLLKELLPQLQFLRVLSLAGYNITEVPRFVCSLKHLRYLNFSNTEITCLPEQFGDLFNLQSLLLSGCYELSSFPSSFVKLINLRHLDISNTPKMKKMSLGISGLSGLQNLSKIVIGKDNEFGLSDLKGQLIFQGELSIKGLHEVKDATQAKEAKLQQRKGICDLIMEWCDLFDDSRNKATEFKVLEELRPSEKLRSLEILYYGGTEFPSWVGDPSFVCLTKLTLRGCKSCKRLPALGQLASLREFIVDGCDNIESISNNGYGFLPSGCLKRLTIHNCKNLKSFPYKHLQSLASLEYMTITYCPSLDYSFPCGLWPPNLRELKLGGLKKPMPELYAGEEDLLEELVSFVNKDKSETTTSRSTSSCLLLPSSLTFLWIYDFEELESVREGMQHLTSLQHFRIYSCPKLRDLPETILPSLETLHLYGVSPELMKKCRREGEYWPLISQIRNLDPDLSLYLFN